MTTKMATKIKKESHIKLVVKKKENESKTVIYCLKSRFFHDLLQSVVAIASTSHSSCIWLDVLCMKS